MRIFVQIHLLALQVEYFNTTGSSSTQPVAIRTEHEGVNNITSLQRVQVFAIIQIPKHGDTVLATRCGEGTIGGDRHCIDVTGVTVMVSAQFALAEFPNLEKQAVSKHSQSQSIREEIGQRSW